MNRKINCLCVGPSYDLTESQKELTSKGLDLAIKNIDFNQDLNLLQTEMKANHVSILNDSVCIDVHKVINKRSVKSHFLDYIDFVENKKGQLWGESIFGSVFRESLQVVLKKNFYKGSVIFLGENIKVLPVLEELSHFGFVDFDFLNLSNDRKFFNHIKKNNLNIFKINVSSVNSTAFVRSQKEYAMCFVLDDKYTDQTLEDMSYFHFLSAQSIVFDLSGHSNFLFKEVKELGIELFENKEIERLHKLKINQKLINYLDES